MLVTAPSAPKTTPILQQRWSKALLSGLNEEMSERKAVKLRKRERGSEGGTEDLVKRRARNVLL